MLTKMLRVVAVAAATLALGVAVPAPPAAAGLTAPTLSFQTVSTSDLSATLGFTVNREPKQIASASCARTDADGTTAAVGCGSRSSSGKQTTYQVTFPALDAGSYRFSVTVTMTDRKQASGSTTFVVAPARATCSVTPYHVTYDGDPHTAAGSCTGVGGAALPDSTLDLSATVHTNAGTYPDTWTFSDPTGNYANESGSVTNVIDPTQQAPKPIPIVHVNWDDDPQSPPLPPDPEANYCPPHDLTGGGCKINALDGSIDNFFDASLSVPADLDPSRVSYHWELFKPPTLGSLPYSSAGITGYRTPVLRIRPSSLPSLTNTALDIFWRVRLTIVVDGRSDLTTVSFFQFDYQQTTLTLQVSTDCQRIGYIDGTVCFAESANGLPATEPT